MATLPASGPRVLIIDDDERLNALLTEAYAVERVPRRPGPRGEPRTAMYTTGSVKRLIQPLALCVVVVLGAFPAVTLACQWACVRQVADQAHHHAGHNESTIHDSHHPAPPADLGFISAERPCAHTETSVTATSTLQFRVFAPVAVQAVVALPAPPIDRTAISVAVATHSPPGARPAPLVLRI